MTLKETKLLKFLNKDQWLEFEKILTGSERSYGKGQIIYLEEDKCNHMDFIVSGRLHVKRHDVEGRTLMVESFNKGDFLGANLLFSSYPYYPMSIISEIPSKIVSIDKETLLKWCQNNTSFLEAYLKEISDKTKVLVQTIEKLSTGTLRDKLMSDFSKSMNQEKIVKLTSSKKELSERYGVARTSLSRELNRMIEDGLIQKIDKDTYQLM